MTSKRPARNSEGGAIAILMALTLTVLVGFAAMGFDLSYVRLARLQMKNASDAAAHAAVLVLRASTGNTASARSAAIAVAAGNTVLGKPMNLQANDVVFGNWDTVAKTFTLGAPETAVKINGVRESSSTDDGYVKLTFGRVLGFSESSVTEDTIGAFSSRNFMIEMDITPSYICDIDNAVKADLSLLDTLHTKNIGGDRISLDVFTGKATEFTPFYNIRQKYSTIYQAWAGGGVYTSFLDGKTSGITVCNKLDDPSGLNGGTFTCAGVDRPYPNNPNIQHCSQDGPTGYATTLYAGTDIGAAITAGANKLETLPSYEPRILIVVTDGSPMTCTAPQGGDACFNGGNPCCADGFCNQANAHASGKQFRADACDGAHKILDAAVDAANLADQNGIDLFMIKITGNATDTSSVFAQSLVRGNGTFNWISDATQLGDIFTGIINQVPVSLVK